MKGRNEKIAKGAILTTKKIGMRFQEDAGERTRMHAAIIYSPWVAK